MDPPRSLQAERLVKHVFQQPPILDSILHQCTSSTHPITDTIDTFNSIAVVFNTTTVHDVIRNHMREAVVRTARETELRLKVIELTYLCDRHLNERYPVLDSEMLHRITQILDTIRTNEALVNPETFQEHKMNVLNRIVFLMTRYQCFVPIGKKYVDLLFGPKVA